MTYQLIVTQLNTCSRHVNRCQTFKYSIKERSSKRFSIHPYRDLQALCAINLSNLWG